MSVMNNIYHSFRALPLWVQIWLGLFLVPANSWFIFILPHPLAWACAASSVVIVLVNGLMLIKNKGLSRVLAIPHLLVWLPLNGYIVYWLLHNPWSEREVFVLVIVLFIINSISLIFDVLDSYAWFTGDRGIVGLPRQKPWV